MSSNHLYVDIHVIQTVPPSNLNRDDAGSPKQAIFGGVRRARVSSQAWKRATRKHFAETTPLSEQGTRTARVAGLLAKELAEQGALDQEQAGRVSSVLLSPLKIKGGRKEENTAYLMFFGFSQIRRIVAQVVERLPGSVETLSDDELAAALADVAVQQELMTGHPLDVALFGRMVANLPAINVDAAVQVAHAISTHQVEIEYDYFTAVDDEKARSGTEDAGAGMIGTVEFNSATLYRYATVGVHQLVDNLGGANEVTAEGVRRFIDGFVRSIPTGHQNSFAHRTLPHAVVVVARTDQPVNLVAAFEKPVRSGGGGHAAASLQALVEAQSEVSARWGGAPPLVISSYQSQGGASEQDVLGPSVPFDEVLSVTARVVGEHLAASAS